MIKSMVYNYNLFIPFNIPKKSMVIDLDEDYDGTQNFGKKVEQS